MTNSTCLPPQGIDPRSLVLWTGAGISADPPTRGPLGRTLTDRALDNYFEPGTKKRLTNLYSALKAPHPTDRPRLETVLDVLAEVHGMKTLEDVMNDLVASPPNRHHRTIASLCRSGAQVITANFDTCIERASSDSINVVHIHGSFGNKGRPESLGARLRVIEHGFPSGLAQRLQEVLEKSAGGSLVFLGYSGSDFFDATPFLIDYLASACPRQIVWHKFKQAPSEVSLVTSPTGIDLLDAIISSGHRILMVEGTLDSFFNNFFSQGTRIAEANPFTVPRSAWRPNIRPDAADRHRATAALFGKLGYRRGTISAFASSPPETIQEHELVADAYWGAGQYRAALRHWRAATPSSSRRAAAHLSEREGAVLWVTGRLIRAERHLWHALLEYTTADPVELDIQAALFETYLRVISHMRRSPDTRHLVPEQRAHLAKRRSGEISTREELLRSLHQSLTLKNAITVVDGRRDEQLSRRVTVFEEREALHAWLNYSHATLRERAEARPPVNPPSGAEYRLHAQRELMLGAHADHMRAMLIPGAPPHFSTGEFLEALRRVEMSPWNRLRFMVLFLRGHYVRETNE